MKTFEPRTNIPLLDKNAYLEVLVQGGQIYANLAYSHYGANRSYVLNHVQRFDRVEDLGVADFWVEYFSALERFLDWEFLRVPDVIDTGSDFLQGFVDEGKGVSGVSFRVDERISGREEISKIIESLLGEINFYTSGNNYRIELCKGLGERMAYEDVVIVNLDLLGAEVARSNGGHGKVHWDNEFALIDNIHNSKFKAFLSSGDSINKLTNLWANFILHPVDSSDDDSLKDLVRAYLTLQVLSIFNNNTKSFEKVGTQKSTLIVLTGEMLELLGEKELMIAIIDGLEIRGQFDLLIDSRHKLYSYGRRYVDGINAQDFIVNKELVINDMYKVLVPEVGTVNEKDKVIFQGAKIIAGEEDQSVNAIAPEVSEFELNQELKCLFDGKFVNSAYIDGDSVKKSDLFEMISQPNAASYAKVIIDGRFKPVVYGPNAKANSKKLNRWFRKIK